MKNDFTATLITGKSAAEVFAIIKNVRGWWSGLFGEQFEGNSEKLNDEFTFRAGEGAHYSKQKLIELDPDKKLVWLVTESNLNFLNDKQEWTNTSISFELLEQDGKTSIVFKHVGLHPEIECYEACSGAWSRYIQEQLKALVA